MRILNSDTGSLLFANDLIILSESKKGLQNSTNNVSNYCEKLQLCLNTEKKHKKTMIIEQRLEQYIVMFNNEKNYHVTEYKFLGTLIKSNGNLNACLTDLAQKI